MERQNAISLVPLDLTNKRNPGTGLECVLTCLHLGCHKVCHFMAHLEMRHKRLSCRGLIGGLLFRTFLLATVNLIRKTNVEMRKE